MIVFRRRKGKEDTVGKRKRSLRERKKVVIKLVRETASVEANTVCAGIYYQPKENESVKQLRKF